MQWKRRQLTIHWRHIFLSFWFIFVSLTVISPVARSESRLELSFKAGRLSIQAINQPLGQILYTLARQIPLQASLSTMEAEEPITLTFRDMPLHQGLRRLLRGKNYLVRFSEPLSCVCPDAFSRINIHLLSSVREATADSAEERRLQQIESASRSLVQLQYQALEALDPAIRVLSLKALSGEAEREAFLSTLRQAVEDPEDQVRRVALSLMQHHLVDAYEVVAHVAQHDPNPMLRMAALSMLVEADPDGAQPVVEKALQDAHIDVRAMAQQLRQYQSYREIKNREE